MSSYKILNAINTAAASAFNSDGKTKAVKTVARFSVKAGVISVNAGTKALESVAPFGVTENEYRAYCDNIKALYFDAVHLAHALESKAAAKDDKSKAEAVAVENKVRSLFYQDILYLVHSVTDKTFKVIPDVFENDNEVRDFEERCVAILQKFVAGSTGYDIEAVKIATFAKWVEPAVSTRLAGSAMLSFEERDRRANLKKWVSKLSRLEDSKKTKEAEIAAKQPIVDKARAKLEAGKIKQATFDKTEQPLMNLKAELANIESNIVAAKANIEKYKTMSTQYTADETLSTSAVAAVETTAA